MRKVNRRWVGVLLTVVLSLGGLGHLVQADCMCVDDDCYEDVIVSGAGSTGVNHTYAFTKMSNDKPFYGTQASGSYIAWVAGAWKMYSDLALRYYSLVDSPTPPSSWERSGLGEDPVPTATGGEACICGPTITVSAISGPTTESGGTATFTLTPDLAPTADVTVPLTSSNTGEGTVPVSVILPSGSTDPVTVTVTGVDDDVDDGDIAYTIITGDPTSADADYEALGADDVDDVSVTNQDDDAVGITVSPTSGLTTTEAGGTDTFTVVLDCEPSDTVTIDISSSDTTEGTAAPAILTFTTANWDTLQTVTVTGVDDLVNDADIQYTILTAAVGGNYAGIDPSDVDVTNSDDDVPGITVSAISGNTAEDGTTATFTVVLDTEPSGTVTIDISSNDTTEGTAAPASLTFTTEDWDTPQTVTVTGVDDEDLDGDIAYTIITAEAACGSSAAVAALGAPAAAGWTTSGCAYAGLDADDVIVINEDDDAVLAPIPTGDAGPDEFLDIVLPLAEGEEPPMIGEVPLVAVHAVGDVVTGSCQFLNSHGQPGLAGYIHIYVYSVDVDTRPETRELVAHWMANYNWDTQEYEIAWDTSELAPGYYDLRLYFGSPDTAQTFRMELAPPVVE